MLFKVTLRVVRILWLNTLPTSFFLQIHRLLAFANMSVQFIYTQSVISTKCPMMQDGQNAECPMVQEFWQDLQGLFAPFTLNFAM